MENKMENKIEKAREWNKSMSDPDWNEMIKKYSFRHGENSHAFLVRVFESETTSDAPTISEGETVDDPTKAFINLLSESGSKITFGLQPNHIDIINEVLKKWNTDPTNDMTFAKCVWEEIGKKCSWDPFTIALYYLRHIHQSQSKEIERLKEEKSEFISALKGCVGVFQTLEKGASIEAMDYSAVTELLSKHQS